MECLQLLKNDVLRQVKKYGVCHSSDSNRLFILINSDQLVQYAEDKWKLEDPFYCDYNIVATLGTPVSGKSKCMSITLLHKLANRD
jgi:hypothetical protein